MKKIVSVKFDDGTELTVDDADLRRYLEQRDIEKLATMFNISDALMVSNVVKAYHRVQREEQRLTNSNNRKGATKPVTKADLVQIRDAFMRDNGFLRGWKKAASLAFDISLKTLNERMRE